MITHHALARPSELRPLDGLNASTLGAAAQLGLHGLETARGLMGAMNAWVTRHSGDGYELVRLLGPKIEADSSLHSLLACSAQNSSRRPVFVVRWKCHTLVCACLSDQQEDDGCIYMLGMLFAEQFKLTERLAGVLDGLRCSLHALIRGEVYWQQMDAIQGRGAQPVACSCCRRMHTSEHGWMHWDDFRFLKTGRGSSHTVCETCALALYGDVLQGKI